MHTCGTEELDKPIDPYTSKVYQRVYKNYKSISALYCSLDANNFWWIFACEAATIVLDTFITTYQGISLAIKSRISIYMDQSTFLKHLWLKV